MKFFKNILFLVFLFNFKAFTNQLDRELLIYAPASLRDALNEVIQSYKKQKIKIVPVYLGTSNLAQQIKNGANPDIFISASIEWMNYLEKRKLILKKYRKDYLYNSLVLVSRKKSSIQKIENIVDLKQVLISTKSRISLAMTRSVPAGIYAKNYLETIGIWEKVKKKIVESTNVRAAMQFVSRGELDYGIVYFSDTVPTKKIKVIYYLENYYHKKIIYPKSVLNEKNTTLEFYDFLSNENSLSIMKKWGFKVKND